MFFMLQGSTMGLMDKAEQASEIRARIDAMPDPLAIWHRMAREDGTKPAMVHWRHPTDPAPLSWSYATCLETAQRLASALRARGVAPHDTVAIIAPSIPEAMVAFVAASSMAVAFPLNLLLSADAIASQLALAEAKVVITFGPHPAFDLNVRVTTAAAATPCVKLVVEIESGAPADPTAETPGRISWTRFLMEGETVPGSIGPADRAAALFHTGGTTGAPKLAELSLSGLAAAAHMSTALGLRSSDRILLLFPFFHVGGAITGALAIFGIGGTLLTCGLAGGRNPDLIKTIWQTVSAMDASLVAMVPATWSVVATLPGPERCAALRGMITGATSMTPDLALRLEQLVGVPMCQVFGMSELSGIISGQPADGVFRAPGVGYPVPLLDIRLDPIADGGPNEVKLRGPNLFKGYRTVRGLEEQPAEDWLASGDLGEFGHDGQLRLTGRRKDVIIRSGHNIDPLSIEDVASGHPDVLLAAAVGIPDEYAGELPVLYVVRRPGTELLENALDTFLTERIAEPPARPRRIFFVPELPLTPIGKIARYRLRQAAAATRAAEDLKDLAPQHVECSDYGARLITIDWATGSTPNQRMDADQRLALLGLRTQHREAT